MKVLYLSNQKNNAIHQIDEAVVSKMRSEKIKLSYVNLSDTKNNLFSDINLIVSLIGKESPDIIQISSFSRRMLILLIPIKLILLKHKCAVIVNIYHLSGISTLLFIIYARVFTVFNVVQVSSNQTKQKLLMLGVPEYKVVVNCPGISDNYVRKLSLDVKKPYIIYVGAEYRRKNLTTVFKALKLFNERNPHNPITLIKVGGYSRDQVIEAENDKEIADLGIEKFVEMHRDTILSEDELAQYYSNAAFSVHPSLLEGFGLTVIEAAKCGCIPLLSNIPAFHEFGIEKVDPKLYIVNPLDPVLWASKFEYVLGLTDSDKKQRRQDLNILASNYSWSSYIQNLINLYSMRFS